MKTKSIQELGISDGTYQGLWGGYEVQIIGKGAYKGFHFTTKDGVRGMSIPVIVTVKNGQAEVEVKGEKDA